jgi:hypothetical protein
MQEDADYKGPKEDCVEECMRDLLVQSIQLVTSLLTPFRPSLPFITLRNILRSTQALQSPQMSGGRANARTIAARMGRSATINQEERRTSQVRSYPPVQHSIVFSLSGCHPDNYHTKLPCSLCINMGTNDR